VDVDPIDFLAPCRGHAPAHGRPDDLLVQPHPLERRRRFRVADARDDPIGRQRRPLPRQVRQAPRPTSSTPATWMNPIRRMEFSSVSPTLGIS
jgi:hypothetical protein